MWRNLKNFITKIQNSDEATKKRWLIGTTAIAMVFVVGLWLIYINWAMKSINNVGVQESSTGFWQILKTGFIVVFDSIKETIKIFTSKIFSERTIIIEP